MATALNAMESNLAALSSASEPDSYTKSQADAKFEAVDTQLAAKATKSDLTAHIAAVDTQLAAAANLALVDTTKMESELNTTRDELVDTKADLQLATDAVAELKTLFADFKASTDEKMNDLEAQLQERKRKRADQDAKNNIAATAATNDDNGETSVGDNTNINTNTDTENTLCVVCWENPRTVVFLPCKHLQLCEICAGGCTECPYCRVFVESMLQVYT